MTETPGCSIVPDDLGVPTELDHAAFRLRRLGPAGPSGEVEDAERPGA